MSCNTLKMPINKQIVRLNFDQFVAHFRTTSVCCSALPYHSLRSTITNYQMRYFKKALIFAPALFTLNGVYMATTVTLFMLPTAHCLAAPGSSLPRDNKEKKDEPKDKKDDYKDKKDGSKDKKDGKGKDDEDESDFFRRFTKGLPHQLREDLSGLMGPAGGKLKNIIESGVPAQVGYGFMMGFSSGFALKKVSRIVAFGVGTIFILVQAMSYQGYINVNYAGIQKDIENLLDLNKDGKVDSKDLEYGFDKVKDVLEYNMPSGGGFTTGLLMGLRG